MAKSNSMSKPAAARIQSAAAKSNSGAVPKGHFASRAQSAAAKNSSNGGKGASSSTKCTPPNGPSKTGGISGKSRGNCPPKGN